MGILLKAIDPTSLPELSAFVVIGVMIFLVSRKRVKLNTLYITAYLAVEGWLLIRFLRLNLDHWFTITGAERAGVAYGFSILLNICIATVCSYWVMFAAAFCQRDDWTTGWKRWLAHLPIWYALLFVPTNPLHHLFYTHLDLTSRRYGPAYPVFLSACFAATLLPLKWLAGVARDQKEPLYKKQALIIIVSVAIPLIGGAFEAFPLAIPPFRSLGLIPFCFTVNGVLICYALLRVRFLDVLPLAIREVFLAMSDAVLVLDEEERLVQANPAAQKVFSGLQPGASLGVCAPKIESRIRSCADLDREEFEAEIDGSVYWIRMVRIQSHSGVAGVLLILTDVTARKRAEDELRQNEERFRSLVQNASDIISIFEADGTIRYESPSVLKVMGYHPEELIGQNILAYMQPEDAGGLLASLQEWLKEPGSSLALEIKLRHKDGTWRILEATGSNLLADPSVKGLVFNSRDVTERKSAEEKIKQFTSELARSNKKLESFAYVASHDLQEPLRKVLAFGDRLAGKYSSALGDDGLDYLRRMQKAAYRMRLLIDDLLAFSRISRNDRPLVQVDLSKVVSDVLSDLEIRLEQSRARVEVGSLGTITADPTQIRQLVQNLVGNGLKFRKKDEPPLIKVSGKPHNGSREFFVLTIEDNGIGFDEKHSERIFEPFQRLHGRDQYEGTGIGLSVCRTIAERHGGFIEARSTPGKGTIVTVTLPINPTTEQKPPSVLET